MQHVLLALLVLAVSTGSAGASVTAVLWFRTRDRVLGIVLVVVSAYAAGLVMAILAYYFIEIVGYRGNLEPLVTIANAVVSVVMYSGLGAIVVMATGAARRNVMAAMTPAMILILLTVVRLLVPGVSLWTRANSGAFLLASVVTASGFLLYAGLLLARRPPATDRTEREAVRLLLASLGTALVVFAALSAVVTITAVALGQEGRVTLPLNFLLYMAWNTIAVIAFVRDDGRVSDILTDGEVSPERLNAFGITSRESDVIRLVARGLSNKEIAAQLGVSFTTVRTHLYNLFKKTGAANRLELIRLLSGTYSRTDAR